MLTQLKKFIAVVTIFTAVMTQVPLAGAFTVGGSSGGTGPIVGSQSSNPSVGGSQVCGVYGCVGSTPNYGSGNNGTSTGNVGSNPVDSNHYCGVYTGCVGSIPNGGGNNGNGNGNGNVGSNPLPPSAICGVYTPCVTQTPGTVPSQPGMSACNNHPYPSDIDGHWAEIYIRRLYDLCVLSGYEDGTFRPDQSITRAELTKMALYSAGIAPNPGCYNASCGSPFVDLDMWEGSWIRPAYDRGIVQGYDSNHFAPNQQITRAEAVKVILSAYGYQPLNVSQSFFNDVSGWSTGWIELAHQYGIVSGVGNGNFDPNRPITRAEAAKIIAKTIEKWGTPINQ